MRTFWLSVFHWFIFKGDALNTYIERRALTAQWQQKDLTQGACILSSKDTYSQIKVSSGCAGLHNVSIPEIQSKWILFTLSVK